METWEEYTLLRIKYNAASEPICLLKFTWKSIAGLIYAVKHSMPLLEYKEIVRQLNVEMTSRPLIKIAGKIETIFKKLSSLFYWRLEYGRVAEQIIDMFDEEIWE